jgi:oxygen-dependent protoporphyrinogen oxidase
MVLPSQQVEELELTDSILSTSRNSIAARNRWIYYPDHLVQVPHPSMGIVNIAFSLATEPVFRGVISGMIHEFFAAPNPPGPPDVDESIGDFISRRFNRHVVDNLLSAIIHGIYAGDVWQLSADMLMQKQRFYEQQYNGLLTGIALDRTLSKEEDAKLLSRWSKSALPVSQKLWSNLRQASFFTFKQGMAELIMRLEETLRKKDNVELKTNTSVVSVFEPNSGVEKLEVW